MKVVLFPNLKKSNARNCVISASAILHNQGVEVFLDSEYKDDFNDLTFIEFGTFSELVEKCDVIIVIGGDGTILKCSKLVAKYEKPILGINSGRLGFMATLESDEIELLKEFSKGNYSIVKRMMLKGTIRFSDGTSFVQSALNDIVALRAPSCKIADFEVSINDTVISALRADGLIFSTPTGATAYSLSAGGPIIEPDLECIEFTQICPFSLFARTMIFNSDKVINIRYSSSKDSDVIINFDGNEEIMFTPQDELIISRSENCIYFVEINSSGFYQSVNKKLMQPLKGESEEGSK